MINIYNLTKVACSALGTHARYTTINTTIRIATAIKQLFPK